tara:strand:+ start:185 stop:1399 length:1215 start_codon:yes stop_codon:yes gene_type:complete
MLQQANQRFTKKMYECFHKYGLWIPVFLFCFTYILVYLKWGINITSGDATAYIEGARRLLADMPLIDWRSKRSIGYELIIALNYWLNFGNTGVIFFQVIINALAAVAIYDLCRGLSGKATGILAASFYVVYPDVVQWTYIVMTESVFTAGLILSCWAYYRIQMNSNSIWKQTLVIILWVYMSIIRPNGWFMLPLFGVLSAINLINKGKIKLANQFIIILTILTIIAHWGPYFAGVIQDNAAQMITSAFNAEYYDYLINGVVMLNAPDNNIQMPITEMNVEPSLISYLLYCIRYPFDSMNLFIHRIFHTTIFSSPYFSITHNKVINISIPILYILAFIGMINKKNEPVTTLILSIVVIQLVIISITVGWSGIRYWVYVLPLITMYSAIGVKVTVKLLFYKTKIII